MDSQLHALEKIQEIEKELMVVLEDCQRICALHAKEAKSDEEIKVAISQFYDRLQRIRGGFLEVSSGFAGGSALAAYNPRPLREMQEALARLKEQARTQMDTE